MTEDVPTHVDLARDFADSGVAEVLAELDRREGVSGIAEKAARPS